MGVVLFLARRLGYSVVVLLGLSILIFTISRVLPGNPARLALGPYATQDQVASLEHQMGLDKPLPVQYWVYVTGLFRGDFGMSFQTRRNVADDIRHYLPATIELVALSIVWIALFGIPLGSLSAKHKDKWLDNGVRLFSFVGVAIAPFVIALLLQFIGAYLIPIFPATGRLGMMVSAPPRITGLLLIDSLISGDMRAFGDALWHLVLPSFALALGGLGQIARISRASTADVLEKNYVEAARGFGIPDRRIMSKYALKPSLIPTVTVLGLTFASSIGNAFLIEQVFSWPGLAKYGVRAILRKDFNSVMGVVLVIGVVFFVANFIVDLIIGYLDPRIRLRKEQQGNN